MATISTAGFAIGALENEVEKALQELAEKTGSVGWPAACPRFEAEAVTIKYMPTMMLWEYRTTAVLYAPEEAIDSTYRRRQVRSFCEEFHLPNMLEESPDLPLFQPYFSAAARVLSRRIQDVISATWGTPAASQAEVAEAAE